jgi:hypothetical protein
VGLVFITGPDLLTVLSFRAKGIPPIGARPTRETQESVGVVVPSYAQSLHPYCLL